MPTRTARDPSPFRSGLIHGVLGFTVLVGSLGTAAATIHLTGDVDAASPSLKMALFENEEQQAPGLNPRLPADDAGLMQVYADSQPGSQRAEPDLGVEYSNATRVSAPAPQAASSVRINGQTVLPGQSLSQVQNSSLQAATARLDDTAGAQVTQVADTPRTIFEINARPFSNPENKPTVSIIVGGLGINSGRTQAAIDELPADVTLSFSPTTINLQTWVTRARRAGHEVLIEVPMEPYDYGRERPHAQVLRVAASSAENTGRLNALLSRLSGYTGVMNYQGGKFATDADAAAPVFEHLTAKGVAFFEDGSLARSVFEDTAASKRTIFGKAGAWIDGRPEADEISNQLMILEVQAAENGTSLGVGMSYPITIDLLKEWADRLESKGLVLAPASYHASQSGTSGQIQIAALDPQG